MNRLRLQPAQTPPAPGRCAPAWGGKYFYWLACAGALILGLAPWAASAAPAEGATGQTTAQRADGRADISPRKPEPRKQAASTQAPESKPNWKELTPAQQTALLPLAPHWDRMAEKRKQKWLLISKSYSQLHPTEQAKLHTRMNEWASFTQRQRSQARQVYKDTKNLTAEQKAEQWRAYQALSTEEKKELAVSARAIPVGATAIKSRASPKLATVPFARRNDTSRSAKVETGTHPVSPQSLLNRQGSPQRDPVPTNPYEDDDEDQP